MLRSRRLCYRLVQWEARLLTLGRLALDRCREMYFHYLVLTPDTVDHLVLAIVDQLASAILKVLLPHALVLDPRLVVDRPTSAVPQVSLELSFILRPRFFFQFSEAIKFAFFELSNILKSRPHQLPEAVRFTVPNLTLIPSFICKHVAALARTSAIFPFASVHVATLKFLPSKSMFFARLKVTSVDIPRLECQYPKAMSMVLVPLSLILIAVLKHLSPVPLFHAINHFTFVVYRCVLLKKPDKVRRL